jgi:hypothetical protein
MPRANRLRRLALRFLVFVCAAGSVAAAYLLMRPPDLVPWIRPQIGDTRNHLAMLVPSGWEVQPHAYLQKYSLPAGRYHWSYYVWRVKPVNRMPRLLRFVFGNRTEDAELNINCYQFLREIPVWGKKQIGMERRDDRSVGHQAYHVELFRDAKIGVGVVYRRSDLQSFNRTYKQICNSLRVE